MPLPPEISVPGTALLTQVGVQFQVALPSPNQFYRFRVRVLDTLQYATEIQIYTFEDSSYWRYRDTVAVGVADSSTMLRQGFDTGASTERLRLLPIDLGQRGRLLEFFVDGI